MDFLKNIEKTLLFPFMDCFDHRPKERLLLEWNDGTRIYTRLDTAGESQNEFDEDEEGFEEYFACIMETVEIVSIGTAPVWNFEVGDYSKSIIITSRISSKTLLVLSFSIKANS